MNTAKEFLQLVLAAVAAASLVLVVLRRFGRDFVLDVVTNKAHAPRLRDHWSKPEMFGEPLKVGEHTQQIAERLNALPDRVDEIVQKLGELNTLLLRFTDRVERVERDVDELRGQPRRRRESRSDAEDVAS